MSSNSVAMKFVSSPARGVSLALVTLRAAIVLAVVLIVWLSLFILFLPFFGLSELLGWRRKYGRKTGGSELRNLGETVSNTAAKSTNNGELIFDRRSDVSKIFGCNTRHVEYRWDLFAKRLNEIKSKAAAPKA